jgi:histidyl-tRNA synthetase
MLKLFKHWIKLYKRFSSSLSGIKFKINLALGFYQKSLLLQRLYFKMKPSTPKGTRDFLPNDMAKRNYIFDSIKKYFQLYGYAQIETPAMENLASLTGKYGEEGDQLLFKILNSRIHESKEKEKLLHAFNTSLEKSFNTDALTERALRYDLTVPTARFVVQHQHELIFPFKRFQIQPVWRADKPQKGRYREFFQCDADIIGSDSLLNEVDLLHLMADVYTALNIPVIIKVNNRKLLSALAELTGRKDLIVDITIAIDKLDKVGKTAVIEELKTKGLEATALQAIDPIFQLEGSTEEKLTYLKQLFENTADGKKGVEELEYLFGYYNKNKYPTVEIEMDMTLARGLNYYTGAIFEVKANIGDFTSSICGGGRYDDLTGIFGLKDMSGVGISFGIDRIYDVMKDNDLFPKGLNQSTCQYLIANFGAESTGYCLELLQDLRSKNLSVELYPDAAKLKKQFEYADKKGIPNLIIAGESEKTSRTFNLKNLASGEQKTLQFGDII